MIFILEIVLRRLNIKHYFRTGHMEEIHVIDNAISSGYQDLLVKELAESPKFAWYLMRDITLARVYLEENNIKKTMPGFAHSYKNTNEGIISAHYPLVLPLVFEACDKINYSISDVIQCRSFMHMPLNDKFHRERDYIHVDLPSPHLICLYYVVDSDGDLLIFDRTCNDVDQSEINRNPGKILQRVQPKKGRVVIMDGNRYHCSSPPTVGPRININFNFL